MQLITLEQLSQILIREVRTDTLRIVVLLLFLPQRPEFCLRLLLWNGGVDVLASVQIHDSLYFVSLPLVQKVGDETRSLEAEGFAFVFDYLVEGLREGLSFAREEVRPSVEILGASVIGSLLQLEGFGFPQRGFLFLLQLFFTQTLFQKPKFLLPKHVFEDVIAEEELF